MDFYSMCIIIMYIYLLCALINLYCLCVSFASSVWVTFVHYPRRPEEGNRFPQNELQLLVSHFVGAGI